MREKKSHKYVRIIFLIKVQNGFYVHTLKEKKRPHAAYWHVHQEKKETNWPLWKKQHYSVIHNNGDNGDLICSGCIQIMPHCVSVILCTILCALRVTHPALKPCKFSWGQLVDAYNTWKRLLRQYSSGAATQSWLVPKATSAVHTQSSAVPSELQSGPAAPKPCACKSTHVAPIFMKILLKSLLFKQKQNLYVQISPSVDKHSPVLALQWIKPAHCKSRQITPHL